MMNRAGGDGDERHDYCCCHCHVIIISDAVGFYLHDRPSVRGV